jgi:hypothetical protein
MGAKTALTALPKRQRGRQSIAAEEAYQQELKSFCATIIEIKSRLGFKVSARGWVYILEGEGVITKGDLDAAERLITRCRKDGSLPLDICIEDETRKAIGLEQIDNTSIEQEAEDIVSRIEWAHMIYFPFSFWEAQDCYVEMAVEKIDLRSLFETICSTFRVPLTTSFMMSNLEDLALAVGWSPVNLTIERFGLNADFIEANNLTWIDNLETSSGGRLDDPRHTDHNKAYVQTYIERFGVRKVEANALVVSPNEGRRLCREAITRYVDIDAANEYGAIIQGEQNTVQRRVGELLLERFGGD